jgi:hypothetical protein
MRISYDKAPSDCLFPLTIKDVRMAMKLVEPGIARKTHSIRFRNNPRSVREGLLYKTSERYQIDINFCLKNFQSKIANIKNKKYLDRIREYGGELRMKPRVIHWSLPDAKLYALDILFHEIGHIDYAEKHSIDINNSKSTKNEEVWCDKYALKMTKKIKVNFDNI